LQTLGFYKGKLGGTFGASLQTAVTSFEKAHVLEADGIVGPTTVTTSNAALAS
jgi:peptidoglycan hydrolase-like protein with peptidoglycan-binding domain